MITVRQLALRMDPVRPFWRLVGDPSAWLDETDPKVWPERGAACADYPSLRSGTDHPVPGKRYDYIFVERPKVNHSVVLDFPSMRRLPCWGGWSAGDRQLEPTHMYSNNNAPDFMSDHSAIEFELIVTPMAKVLARR